MNHVNGVEFQTTEFKRHRESARELALKARGEGRKDGSDVGMQRRRAAGNH